MQRKKIHNVKIKNPVPDQELLRWEEWIKIRNNESTKLAKKLHKSQAGLVMNISENIRGEMEWKTAIEHAQIQKRPTIRGNLWQLPNRLKQDTYYTPTYEVQRTAAELGRPRIIEHISVPDYIQKVEKGLTGESDRIKRNILDLEFKKYRTKREDDLKETICKLDPYRPDAGGLLIKGNQPRTPPKKIPPLPNITITTVAAMENTPNTVYAVRINNTVVYKDLSSHHSYKLEQLKLKPWHETCTSWSYYFTTPAKRAGRCKLFLENLGTAALKYCWKKIKKPIPYIPEATYEQVFFFNKNEDIISPGQRRDIFFTFISNTPGIYSEVWELSFSNINFFDTLTERFSINLSADSIEKAEKILKKCEILKTRIDKKAITNIVCDILNDAFMVATTTKPQQYPYKHLFLEAEMFTMKNPVCYYHQTEVLKAMALYSEMVPGCVWDLSIATWRAAMMSKEFDERMKYYELLRQSHSDFLKPWHEGETLLKSKYRAVKILLGQMANMFDKKYGELIDHYTPPRIEVLEEDKKKEADKSIDRVANLDPYILQNINNLFYLHAYEYLVTAIEMCSGVLSSLELNRWIEFDFCQL